MTRRSAVVRAMAVAGCVCCVIAYGGAWKGCATAQDSDAARRELQRRETARKELGALVDFLKSKGVDLQAVEKDVWDNVIGHRLAVGRTMIRGIRLASAIGPGSRKDYVPPITLPYAVHGNWILWWIKAPEVTWEKVRAAFKEYRGGAKSP